MTLADYMDSAKFPLTTQGNLKPSQQIMIDAFNHDQIKELIDNGKALESETAARWKELQEKALHRARLVKEAAG